MRTLSPEGRRSAGDRRGRSRSRGAGEAEGTPVVPSTGAATGSVKPRPHQRCGGARSKRTDPRLGEPWATRANPGRSGRATSQVAADSPWRQRPRSGANLRAGRRTGASTIAATSAAVALTPPDQGSESDVRQQRTSSARLRIGSRRARPGAVRPARTQRHARGDRAETADDVYVDRRGQVHGTGVAGGCWPTSIIGTDGPATHRERDSGEHVRERRSLRLRGFPSAPAGVGGGARGKPLGKATSRQSVSIGVRRSARRTGIRQRGRPQTALTLRIRLDHRERDERARQDSNL